MQSAVAPGDASLETWFVEVPGGVMVSGMSLLEYSIGRDLEAPS